MHNRNSIISIPLLAGIVVSVAIHVAAFYSKGIYTPPKPSMEQGRTVVHLTLVPAMASHAATPEPEPKEPAEQPIEPQVEPDFQSALPAEPVVEPQPESQPQTVAETTSVDSQELDASLVEEKGVTAEAQPFKPVKPTYPRISRRRGEEGTVTLSIEVLQNGRAGKVSLVQSSGHRRLDEAAQKAVQQTTFTPARQFGRNIDSTTELSFTFRLTDD